jgi:hypothetical protein
VRWVPVPHPPQSSGTAALAPVGTAGDREGATGVNMGAPNQGKDYGPSASGVRAEGSDAFATVRADEVRAGDWVRWPDDSDTMRRITAHTGGWRDGERVYVGAYSAYDDYEYEWLNSQSVVVLRGLDPSKSGSPDSAEPLTAEPSSKSI